MNNMVVEELEVGIKEEISDNDNLDRSIGFFFNFFGLLGVICINLGV